MSNTVKVYDLRTVHPEPCQEFDQYTFPDYAVAYAYCEENNLMSWFFKHAQDGTMDEVYVKLPFTRTKTIVACGDFATRLY